MGTTDGASSILKAVLDCPSRAVALHGPAASGKTTAAVGFYRHYASPGDGARCLLVLPNAATVAAVRRRLLEQSPTGVLVRPRLTTLVGLAGTIVGGAARPRKALSAFAADLLLRQVVDELAAGRRLGAMEAVADTPGLVAALGRAIAELKRAAVEPEVLERAVRAAGGRAARQGRDKSWALLEVYRVYQDRLLKAGAYDTEGLFWEARDQLAADPAASAPPPGLEGIRAIAVDGFTDFGPTQLAILAHLARRMEKVLITLPLDLAQSRTDARARLWRTTARALEGLRRTFGKDLSDLAAASGPEGPAGRGPPTRPAATESSNPPGEATLPRSLWDDLFLEDPPRRPVPRGLAVLAAGSLEVEASAVAWRVKRLLLAGAPPGSIAVLARSLAPYRQHIERTFRECGIPFRPFAQDLTDVPVVRHLLEASALAPGFEYASVLRVIKSSYFRPSAAGPFTARTVATAEMLIRRGNVLGGRKAYADAAQRLAGAASARRDRTALPDEEGEATVDLGPLAASIAELAEAGRMLEGLFRLAEQAASGAPAEALARLAGALQLEEAARACGEPEWIARDLRALAALRAALAQAGECRDLAELRQALAAVQCPGARGESLVDVCDVLDARAMRYAHVFLLGAAEGQFPRRFSESSLLTEGQRAAWAPHGAALDLRRDLTCREMLLFYLAASRAEGTLTISFPDSDPAGRPGAPSAMLVSLLEPLGGMEAMEKALALHRVPRGQFLVAEAELASPGEAVTAAVAGLFGPQAAAPPSAGAALRWAAQHRPEALRRAAWGLYARDRRWRRGPCDAYDGRLCDPAILKAVAERHGPQAAFSASQLNSFGQCPWQFFASYVLHLAPLEEPQRRLEPVARGLLCHDVLQDAFSRLGNEFGLPVRLGAIDAGKVEAALSAAMAEQARRIDLRRPPYRALWEILQRQALRQLRDYLLAQRERPALEAEALCFELAFGLAGHADGGTQDPRSQSGPVPIQTSRGEFLLRGKIDRVDRIVAGPAHGLFVVDYKTGALPGLDDILCGRSLQLPLYAAAAQRLLGEPCVGGAFHGIARKGREVWFAAARPRRGKMEAFEEHAAQQSQAMDAAGGFVQGIRAGRFDLLPSGDCPGYCPFARICQFSPARAEVKAPVSGREGPG